MMPPRRNKNAWALLLVMLAGLVAGGFVGRLMDMLAGSVEALSFLSVLNYSQNFGLSPITVDLGILTFTVGLMINFSVWGMLGVAAAVVIYRGL
jgi:hypothetical protein